MLISHVHAKGCNSIYIHPDGVPHSFVLSVSVYEALQSGSNDKTLQRVFAVISKYYLSSVLCRSSYYKTLIFGGYFYLALLSVKTKIAKLWDREIEF